MGGRKRGPTPPFPKFLKNFLVDYSSKPHILEIPRRMGIATNGSFRGNPNWQSPAVLSVKPAYEDVDAGSFLAFLLALVEDRIVLNFY